MKFYIDTASVQEIQEASKRGWVDGVTTNPSLVAKAGKPHDALIAEICKVVRGPVSAEVLSTESGEMVKEGKRLAAIAPNVVVKIPMTEEGLIAVRELTSAGIQTNVTLVFSAIQALMAAKAGATMVSPFVGRIDDIAGSGMQLINQIVQIFDNYGIETDVLVASVRHPMHVLEAALLGADSVTLPYSVMKTLLGHPLTDKGLAQFLKDAGVKG